MVAIIITFSIKILNDTHLMTLCKIALIIMTLSLTTLRIMKLIIMKLIIMTQSLMIFSILISKCDNQY